ncbi:hypothetical protein HXP44_29110 [Streptomyces sioyaensis]|uniref:Uncharacterized protein n=1 Tax=Streptomyces sioyaensis TaxID=67364 RepID=A0A4Q1QZE0_9ACTN|nr:hypothetical protein [Streptomyces sioyaensis]RXS65351.1 hypothetical protein EST54_18985 [Streptomyces sioyaensis]
MDSSGEPAHAQVDLVQRQVRGIHPAHRHQPRAGLPVGQRRLRHRVARYTAEADGVSGDNYRVLEDCVTQVQFGVPKVELDSRRPPREHAGHLFDCELQCRRLLEDRIIHRHPLSTHHRPQVSHFLELRHVEVDVAGDCHTRERGGTEGRPVELGVAGEGRPAKSGDAGKGRQVE